MTKDAPVPTLVLGAGLTGLSCADHLGDPSRYRLIEKHPSQVGGLAKTLTRPNGFLCDGTGHWLHLATDEMRRYVDAVLGDNLAPRERRARVYSKGVFTLYPFQANTFGLPNEVVAECLHGLVRAKYEEKLPPPANYEQWIRKEFGEGIAKHFMFPYNQKIYGVPLATLSAGFAEKYVPRPSIEAVINGALGLSKEALGYNARFVYPKKGGIGALSEGIHARLARKAEHGRSPLAIDLPRKTVTLDGGELVVFETLVSTIPLPELVRLCAEGHPGSVPDTVVEAGRRLRANSVLYFDVAIRGSPGPHQDYHWIYFPETSLPFYRVGSYSAVERSLAPEGHRSYYVEIAQVGDLDPARFVEPVVKGLRSVGILEDEEDLVFMIPNVLSPAYVLVDHAYEAARRTILEFFETQPVSTVGRYGRWQYNAMEDALREGKEAASWAGGRSRR
ncbi:MAG: NAD(P)-binding protein [Deltaproteobacteria bacterium]|nr:NAD(P)-binding protein [Deltaproteobacteria bacterium]